MITWQLEPEPVPALGVSHPMQRNKAVRVMRFSSPSNTKVVSFRLVLCH